MCRYMYIASIRMASLCYNDEFQEMPGGRLAVLRLPSVVVCCRLTSFRLRHTMDSVGDSVPVELFRSVLVCRVPLRVVR
jgi:hypothetical protein